MREYGVVDVFKQQVLALRRSGGRWAETVVRSRQLYKTGILPSFKFDCAAAGTRARE